MARVNIAIELAEETLSAIEEEAGRRGITVTELMEETVSRLLKEEHEHLENDIPIIPG